MYGGLLLSSSRWSVVRHCRKHDEGPDTGYETNDRSQDECQHDPSPKPRAEVLSISVHALSLANLLCHEKYSFMRSCRPLLTMENTCQRPPGVLANL